ncbi:MAG: UDP-glucose 4-epimerase [Patescibacteria group bacterium]|jgi:UDP-glucose 4-epimerase
MSQTILVTGGAGYIGGFTVRQLLDEGYKVVVIDSLENGHREAIDTRAVLEVINIADSSGVSKVFQQYKPVAVIDFAAYLAVGESMEDPLRYMKNNVENFIGLLDVMVKHGCKYVIKSSTASTYGDPLHESDFPLREDYQATFKPEKSALLPGKWDGKDVSGERFFEKIIDYYRELVIDREELALTDEEITKLRIPASVYGLTKLLDEILMKKYDNLYGVKSVALRYFNVCGAGENGEIGEDKPKPTTLMTLCFWNILGRTAELSVFGDDYPTEDGTCIRDYIHPLDLATGHIAALRYLTQNNASNVFNLGNGKGYSVFDVIREAESASGKKVNYKVVSRRSGDPAVSYCDPSRAGTVLGWKASHDLSNMAKTAWDWHSKHPEGYAAGPNPAVASA